LIKRLLNLIEKQAADLRDLQAENQRLRDEINRLK
jgi:cell division protein FtsB